MDEDLKALVRRELVMDLIKCDMNQEQMENYLKSPLEQLPSEWLKGKGEGTDSKILSDWLDEKFPKEEAE